MTTTSKVLAVLALVAMAAASSEAGGPMGISLFCKEQLGSLMAENKEVRTNLQAALQQAKEILSSPVSERVEYRADLSAALSAVAEDQACSKRSIHHVNTIDECQPDRIEEMQMLVEAAQRYTQKCFGQREYWDGRLKKGLARLSRGGVRGLLGEKPRLITQILDDNFIAEFDRGDPRPQGYSFYNVGGQGCCQARKAGPVLKSAFERFIGPVNQTYYYEEEIEKVLFEPCDRYHDTLFDLMNDARCTADLYPGGESAFIQSQSKDFQVAVFRYMFCFSLGKYLPHHEKIKYIGFKEMSGE